MPSVAHCLHSRVHTWAQHRGLSFGTTLLIQPHLTPRPLFRLYSPLPCPPNNARSRLSALATAFSSLQMTFLSVQTMPKSVSHHSSQGGLPQHSVPHPPALVPAPTVYTGSP